MRKILSTVSVLVITMLIMAACVGDSEYHKITASEAKQMMADTVTILDVRTESEFDQGHISGAILIPDYDILEKAESKLTDKNATILVYCRSGNRSETASKNLIKLGYTNVYDFGGIIDWEYGLVT